jgi:hypothetical protein
VRQYACRPVDDDAISPDGYVRVDRRIFDLLPTYPDRPLRGVSRRAFNAACDYLAEVAPDAVIVASAAARSVHLVLARADRHPEAWAAYFPDLDAAIRKADDIGLRVENPLGGLAIRRARRRLYGVDDPRPCARCGETKPAEEFRRRGREGTDEHDRRQAYCRTCQDVYRDAWHAEHPYADRSGNYAARGSAHLRIAPGESKRCPDCDKVRPVAHFSTDRTRRDGLSTYCRGCTRRRRVARQSRVK